MQEDHPVIRFGNLYKSLRRIIRGVTWKDGVAIYSSNALKNTYKLKRDILNNVYKLLPYNEYE